MLDDAQIEAQMQDVINATWPPAKREKAMRTGILLPELNAFFAEMSVLKTQKIAERDFERQVVAYDAAVIRYNAPLPDVPATVIDESGITVTNPVLVADAAERAAAKAVIDGASQAVLDLVALRNPPAHEPIPEEVIV